MYEKYTITAENKKSVEDKSIDTVFVTFKSMSGKSKCLSLFADAEHLAKEDPDEEKKQFLG